MLVSACLLGAACAYDGRPRYHRRLHETAGSSTVAVCPEQLGGLCTPRLPSEITGGTGCDVLNHRARVLNSCGDDLSYHFRRGAWETVKLGCQLGAELAVFKPRSPSCGPQKHYDGTFSEQLRRGSGVTASALQRVGIGVLTPRQFLQDFAEDDR